MVHMQRKFKPTLLTIGNVKLSFGDIVALAGDFYEHPQAKKQVSNDEIPSFGSPGSISNIGNFVTRFEEAFNTVFFFSS